MTFRLALPCPSGPAAALQLQLCDSVRETPLRSTVAGERSKRSNSVAAPPGRARCSRVTPLKGGCPSSATPAHVVRPSRSEGEIGDLVGPGAVVRSSSGRRDVFGPLEGGLQKISRRDLPPPDRGGHLFAQPSFSERVTAAPHSSKEAPHG